MSSLKVIQEKNNTKLELIDISGASKISIQTSEKSQMNDLQLNGDLTIDTDKFVVESSTGNVNIAGNLTINGIPPNGFMPFSYNPIVFVLFNGSPFEPPNIAYNVNRGTGYVMRDGSNIYAYLSVFISLSNVGTYDVPTDQVAISTPEFMTPTTDRRWTAPYLPNSIQGYGSDPTRYPFCFFDSNGNFIRLSRWTSIADPEIAEQPIEYSLLRNTSQISFTFFVKLQDIF